MDVDPLSSPESGLQVEEVINTRRACTARVMVLVCLPVVVCHLFSN